jgi:hypothetical protein
LLVRESRVPGTRKEHEALLLSRQALHGERNGRIRNIDHDIDTLGVEPAARDRAPTSVLC